MTSIGHGKLTYKDYVGYPDDGRRHEIIDGEHYVNSTPSTYHQTVSRHVKFQLYSKIELTGRGYIFNSPIDLELSPNNIIQPDLVTVLDRLIITPTKIKGVPDLVVEILSPSSERNDRVLKFELYEKSGVAEYWIVDPHEHVVGQCV